MPETIGEIMAASISGDNNLDQLQTPEKVLDEIKAENSGENNSSFMGGAGTNSSPSETGSQSGAPTTASGSGSSVQQQMHHQQQQQMNHCHWVGKTHMM